MFRFHYVRNALQRVNTVLQLTQYKRYYNIYRFSVFEHKIFFVNVLYTYVHLLRTYTAFKKAFENKATYCVRVSTALRVSDLCDRSDLCIPHTALRVNRLIAYD